MENDDQLKPAVDVSAFTPLQQYYYAEQLRCEITAKHFEYLALQQHAAGHRVEEVDLTLAQAGAQRNLARAWQRLREASIASNAKLDALLVAYPPPAAVDWADVVADPLEPPGAALCQQELRRKGNPYPRTCKVCGLGPCHYQGKTP